MSNKSFYLVGADPELSVVELFKNSRKEYRSVHEFFPGTKQKPIAYEFGAIQLDGTAPEYNIKPADNADDFVRNNVAMLKVVQGIVKEHNPNWTIFATPASFFEDKYWDSIPAKVKRIGCSPDMDSKSGEMNPAPKREGKTSVHAGHLHYGWTNNEDTNDLGHVYDCKEAVNQLACSLYVLSDLWDTDTWRRKQFRPGAMRVKPYGVEWRGLSNAWTKDPDLMRFVFEASTSLLTALDSGNRLLDHKLFEEALGIVYDYPKSKMKTSHILKIYDELCEKVKNFPTLPDAYVYTKGQ